MQENILLTGPPRIGKTTVIIKTLNNLDLDTGGFYTQEIIEQGRRTGFKILTLDGREGILSSTAIKGPSVGKYRVNLFDLDGIATDSILKSLDKELIVIDEIGKMELLSEKFRNAVEKALSTCKVLGTIKMGRDPFTQKIRERSNIEIINVTYENRDILPQQLIRRIE